MIWTLQKAACRAYHYTAKPIISNLWYPIPELLSGAGKVKELPKIIRSHGLKKILVVTDQGIMDIGLANPLLQALDAENIQYVIYDKVQPNPSIQNVESGLNVYRENNCEGIIAFGGGSPMDCAKIIGARATSPRRSIPKMKGLFKIFWKLPPLYAVPTTSGTGSEATVFAIVTDPEEKQKFPIVSLKIVPKVAVLDPELTLGLPPHITSTTGMDALTHAIESYISLHSTTFTDEYAEKAVRILFQDLELAHQDGSDLERRNRLAIASYYAGIAFTRAMVGYVHSIAHNLGGLYGVPHGLANAVVLPHVLDASRKDTEIRLARLAVVGGLGKEGEPAEALSYKLIEKVRTMNRNMEIPETIKEIVKSDIPVLAKRAKEEAHPLYPVPTLLNQTQLEEIIEKITP